MNTLDSHVSKFKPAVTLERYISRGTQGILRIIFFFGTLTFLLLVFMGVYIFPGIATSIWWGVGLIFLGLWLDQILTFGYHNSWYFRGLTSPIGEDQKETLVTYEVAQVVLQNTDDVTRAFCESQLGQTILIRSRILPAAITEFLSQPRRAISTSMIHVPDGKTFTLTDLGQYLISYDSDFKKLFTDVGIPIEHFMSSLRWIVNLEHKRKRLERWWSKENLSKTSGLGREWSYGTAYTLERYSRSIYTSAVYSTLSNDPALAEATVEKIEAALAKGKGSNVLLIGEAGVGKMDLVLEVSKRMKQGKSIHAIAGQQMHVLDTARLFAMHRTKQELEETILHLFEEALIAGNNIIVIENISTVIKEAEGAGVFLPEILDQYLATTELHVIATDTPGAFHQLLEPLGGFTRRFSEILLETADKSATTRVLEAVAITTESKQNIIFTYESLAAITEAADRYIVEGVMPDKAINLLVDIASAALQEKQILITADFVYQQVSQKTNVPAGPINDDERDLLLHLEDKLHEQIIGQQAAIDAIARTMRRARAGIQASDKPIGSFLFLGPTGVGKTETAKALANIFFKGAEHMRRIDMSEYSDPDAVRRLIGDQEESGALADMLREHPYSVVLLDEFEKAHRSAHDLFLQILDEGIFTDGRGNKVNARNTIIIATSNAGAQLILKTVQERQSLVHLEQEIINHIIESGIFRPELLNRFDSAIIFEPLTKTEQSSVAGLLLKDLYERIKDRGYELVVGPELMQVLVDKGYNPEFGARPMQRVLQDLIEEKVAQKIISGAAQKGDTLNLTINDFTQAELSR